MLAADGGVLTDEQRDANDVGCGEGRLVVIDGQAGTGKSTVLRAVARAHQHAGRDILVTSSAALAVQRLGAELDEAGVDCSDYSTVGLILAARKPDSDHRAADHRDPRRGRVGLHPRA